MSLNHSPETHQNLLERIPTATGRDLGEWFSAIDEGPSFLRRTPQASLHSRSVTHPTPVVRHVGSAWNTGLS
jgi:hypothetical protein